MKVETILTTIVVTLVIAFISWTGLQIVANAGGVMENKTGIRYIEQTLGEIRDDVRYIRERVK